MRKKLLVLLLALAGILSSVAAIGPVPKAEAWISHSYDNYWVYGPYHLYYVSYNHYQETDWGWTTVEAWRYPLQGGNVIDKQVDMWFRDSACMTPEADSTSPMLAFRATSEWVRGYCDPMVKYSTEAVNEVDIPNSYVYGYLCTTSCVNTTINGSVSYGTYAPLDRTSFSDPHIRLL